MSKSRTPNWRPPREGDPLKDAMLPHVVAWLHNPYLGETMRSGIDSSSMQTSKDLLTDLLRVDPRGGYFGQGDILNSTKAAIHATDGAQAIVNELAEKKKVACPMSLWPELHTG